MRVLVVNAGSSSLKLSVLDGTRRTDERELPASSSTIDASEVLRAVTALGPVDAIGHRIVHGGIRYTRAVRIDDRVVEDLRGLAALAPLHQAKSLEALDVVTRALPDVPSVACFDTAFHASLPAEAHTYAVPLQWRERWGIRRYGFHGLAHASAAGRAAAIIGRPVEDLRLVTCHLGSGASLAAIEHGRSVDTTMGFTPLEGLVMGTRSGSLDPGLLLWLLEHTGMSEPEMAHALEHESGLAALGGDADMRAIVRGAQRRDPRAVLALGVYLHRLRAGVAAMAAAMGGLDGLVFSGGVGERAPVVRAGAADGLAFLGVELDDTRNAQDGSDREIGAPDARVRSLVVEAGEDREIARQAADVLGNDA